MARFTVRTLLCEQWTHLPPPLRVDLTGKTVVVIGASTGIGLEAAIHFAEMKPARLIIGCRSEERGRGAMEEIRTRTGLTAEIRAIDLANFSTVNAFAAGLGDAAIDILVANAGIGKLDYETTSDAWELHLQVNHLSTALVSLLLVPNLARAATERGSLSRLVIVGSAVHAHARLDKVLSAPNLLQALNDKDYASKPATMAHRYHDSKLLNLFFTRAFAEHLKTTTPVIAANVEPGFSKTGLRRDSPRSYKAAMAVMDVVMGRSAEEGSRQLVWAALGPEDLTKIQDMHGAYVSTVAIREPSDFVISREGHEAQERLWTETLDVLKRVSPGLDSIIATYF